MNRTDDEIDQRISEIRSRLGGNTISLLTGFASQCGLDGGKSVVEGVIQTLAKSEHDIPEQPERLMQWMRSAIESAANQVNTPGGEGPAGPDNGSGWQR